MSARPVRHRSSARPTAIGVVVALILSVLVTALVAPPASAVSAFDINVTSPDGLIAGTTGELVFTVFNGGPDPSTTTLLEFSPPAGITVVGPTNCVVPAQCLIGSFGLIAPGDTATVRTRVLVDPDYVVDNGGGTPVATATFPTQVSYDGGAQSKGVVLSVGERSDLRVRKYVNPPVADAGDVVSYGIDVDNLGPSTARTVTIADAVFGGVGEPGAQITIQSCAYSVSQGGGAIVQFNCTTGPIFTGQFGVDVGTFVTDVLQPIGLYPGPNPGDPGVVGGRLRASFRLTANDVVTFDNEVRVLSATADPDQSNNIAAVAHSFEAVADVGLTKTVDVASADPGDLVTYTVTATNAGPSDATNVVVDDLLPTGLELVSATSPDGTCLAGTPGDLDDPVRCLMGTIGRPVATVPISETITITARVTASPGATIVNRALVSSATPDLDNSDDGAQAVVVVTDPELLFNPLVPARQFDTRTGSGGVPVGKVPAGTPLAFTVTGVNGVPVGAAAVSLNVTAENPDSSGWLKVYPCDTPAGTASNLNFAAGQTVANAVIAPVDAAGQVCFYATTATNIISDVSGWFRAASGLTTMTPVRELDTRTGTGGVPIAPLTPGSALTFDVTGVNGVPAAGVSAVILNVTAAEPQTLGHVSVFPCGAPPHTSNLNYVPDVSVPNLVIAPVNPDGTVCFSTNGTTDLVADLSGWFASGSDQHALNPSRLFDTRHGLGGVPDAPLAAGAVLEVDVTGLHGVPASGVGAVILNVTATNHAKAGYVAAFPCGDRPLTSNVNFDPHQTVPNAVLAPISPEGTVCFSGNVSTDLVVDVSGWFTGGPTT